MGVQRRGGGGLGRLSPDLCRARLGAWRVQRQARCRGGHWHGGQWTYSFVSQIAAFTDPALERDYVYCRALSLYLRDSATAERLDLEHLSSIVEVLNERFGTDLTDVDKLLLDQFEESWVVDGELSDQAQNNSIENFRLVFDRKFLQTIITRVDANDEIYKKILDDEDFRATLGEFYLRRVYERLRAVA
jgi:hypothetical protein